MSKAFYKPSMVPELLYRYKCTSRRSVEIWLTTCIVTNFGKKHAKCHVLINPSNPQLSGVQNFPYFPRGGPVPDEKPMSMHKDWQPLGFVTQWGGMEVGHGMLYPVSVVDGLVHQYGGWRLKAECQLKQALRSGEAEAACPVGSAVMTSSGGLRDEYDAIVHTTPPFYKYHDSPEIFLSKCYQSAFKKAFAKYSRVATPLLGAGARGFPENVAINVAAMESRQWCNDGEQASRRKEGEVLAFGMLEKRLADELAVAIEEST